MKGRLSFIWDLIKRTFAQWQEHRSAQLAASLAFYGALALAGLTLAGTYAAAMILGRGSARAQAEAHAGHVAGSHNAQVLDFVLRTAASRHDAWLAPLVGGVVFLLAVTGCALQLQSSLDIVWNEKAKDAGKPDAKQARRHAPAFALIYGLTLLLIALLFAGATVHALIYHTHRLPALRGTLYQGLDVGASIVLLTFVFVFIFEYLPPVHVPWRTVWIGSFVSAVLFERGQFGLSVYLGQMDARSPYADAGAMIAVLLWLYYSAQIVLVGADFTKALDEQSQERVGRGKRPAQRNASA